MAFLNRGRFAIEYVLDKVYHNQKLIELANRSRPNDWATLYDFKSILNGTTGKKSNS